MNTLQLPRDIEKALQLSWDDMHPLTEKYKSEIAEKLSTIMCIPKKNVSCRSKSILRYLNSVYNIKLTQGVGIRTLLINNSVLTSLRVTCYNYTLAELYLIDLACNYILSQPNFQPGKQEEIKIADMTIEDHIKRLFNYKLGKINSTIERRLKKEFGFTLNTKTFSLPELVTVQVEVYREGVLIYTNEDDFKARDGRIIHSLDVKRRMKALKTNGWLYLLSKIPTPNRNTANMNTLKDSIFSLEKELQSFQESIVAIKECINRRDEIHTVPYNAQIDSIRAKFNQMVKDYNKYIKEQ